MEATIYERGNGLPDVGDYVSGDDGEVYVITSLASTIHTSPRGNFVYGCVKLADWTDVTDDNEPTCSAVVS